MAFDRTIRIWDVERDELVTVLSGIDEASLAWSPDGNYLAASWLIFEVGTWKRIRTLDNEPYGGLSSVAWSPESDFLASGGRYTVNKWDVATGDLLITVQGHTAYLTSVTWSPDVRYIASGAEYGTRDGSIKIWNVETGNEIRTIRVDCLIGVLSVDWNPDGKYLAATDCVTVKVFEAATGKLISTLPSGGASSVEWSPDGQYLAAPADRRIKVWRAETWELVTTLEYPPGLSSRMTWSPDSKYIAVVPWDIQDTSIKIFELETEKFIRTIEGDPMGVFLVSWSPDGRYLASSSFLTINIQDVETGDFIRTIDSGPVIALTWSPDSKYLASGYAGGGDATPQIRIWEIETGNLINTLLGHTFGLKSVKWSRDGRYIASAAQDGTVRLWGEGSKE